MRALMVVDVAPGIKARLRLRDIGQRRLGGAQGLLAQAAVEAFVFALGLRMVGTAMADLDPQEQQPDRQARPARWPPRTAPGRPIITQEAPGQPVGTEERGPDRLDARVLLVGQRVHGEGEAAVIVEHGQGSTAADHAAARIAQGEGAEKVTLPQVIGARMLEALPSALGAAPRQGGRELAVAPQDARDGAGGGDRLVGSQRLQPRAQLACAPGGLLGTQAEDARLHRRRGLSRRRVGAARLVVERRQPALLVAREPFIAGGTTNPEVRAQRAQIGIGLRRLLHKRQPQRHGGRLLPGHGHLRE